MQNLKSSLLYRWMASPAKIEKGIKIKHTEVEMKNKGGNDREIRPFAHKMFYTLVTGASSGIGKAIAEKCASLKMNLILIALPCSGLERIVSELQMKYKVDIHCMCLNLTEADAPYKILAYCKMYHLHVNMLINNAGLGGLGAFENTDHVNIQYMMTLNMNTMVSLTRLFLDQLKSSGKGYILNVGSMASLFPIPYKSIYSATKSFVLFFSRSLRYELKNEEITVSCLCPGPTLTNVDVQRVTHKLGWKARFLTLNPQQVAHSAITGLMKGAFLIVPGWSNKVLTIARHFVPNNLVSRLLLRTFKKEAVKP